jgi:hypothetical protein
VNLTTLILPDRKATLQFTLYVPAMSSQHQSRRARNLLLFVSATALSTIWFLFPTAQSSRPISLDQITKQGASQHPVQKLVKEAQANHLYTLSSQSNTYQEAVDAYRLRYRLEPPSGFKEWFDFAKKSRSQYIDQYDSIHESISAPLAIPGKRLQEMVEEALHNGERLYKCGYKDGKATGACGKWDLNEYMAEIEHLMPDVELLFSDYDEPRVVPSADPTNRQREVVFENHSHQNVTDLLYSTCHEAVATDATRDLPFVEDIRAAKDICKHPEYSEQHGFLMSPSTLKSTRQAVPIIAQTKVAGMGDILYPVPYYAIHADDVKFYNATADLDWEDKTNDLYWAGSNNGGYFDNRNWEKSHRHRFVAQAANLYKTAFQFLNASTPGKWTTHSAEDPGKDLYNVAFTDVWPHLCDEKQCEEQKQFYPMKSEVPSNEQFRHRLLIDIDGNSYSGRFYAHLRSKSLSLKQTIFKEWHDDRLVPWVHYVPVSMGLKELPELVRYLVTTDEGSQLAHAIAEEGRLWHDKVLRKEDMQVYMFRLILEYRRLLDPNRPAM